MTTDQQLGAIVMRAVEEAEQMRAQGADRAQVYAALEAVIREAWPKGRSEPWRSLCGDCRDYGWRIYQCDGDATCGRLNAHAAHDYAVACWCEKGRAFIAKPKREVDELSSVGKMPKAPSRWGRS